jgi:hypothetical protein
MHWQNPVPESAKLWIFSKAYSQAAQCGFFCATIMVAVRGGAFGFAGFPLSAGFCGPAYGHHPARKTDDDLIQYLKGVKL